MIKACVKCGKGYRAVRSNQKYCPTCAGNGWRRKTKGKTTKERGLGNEHEKERARLLPAAYGRLCPYHRVDTKCPGVMRRGQDLDLDHGFPRVLGGTSNNGLNRIAHTSCNRRAGARLAVMIRRSKTRRGPDLGATSRIW
jgi:hypothetical protein